MSFTRQCVVIIKISYFDTILVVCYYIPRNYFILIVVRNMHHILIILHEPLSFVKAFQNYE